MSEKLPKGWAKKRISDFITHLGSGVSVNASTEVTIEAEHYILKTSCVSSGFFDKNEKKPVLNKNEIKRLKERLNNGSIIINRSNTPSLVGSSAYVATAPENTFLPDKLWQVKIDKTLVSATWFSFLLSFQEMRESLRKIASGTSGSMKNISKNKFLSLQITLPPLLEQKKMSEIFSSWDAAIVCTQKLLENSKQQKKALMQQLLIGNQHTVSSVTTWKSYKFSELFTTLCNANNPRADLSENGEYGYIHYGDIHKLTTDFLDCNQLSISKISKNKLTKIELLKEGDLLVADASEDYQGIGKSVEIKNLRGRHIVAGLHTILLRDNKKFLLDGFKGYIQHIPHVSKGLQKAATGISVLGISKRALLDVDVLLPPLDEQKAIADVLAAADALIAQYETRLAHLQQQKKALMQQLLTGKIRVMPDTLGNAGATPA